MNPVTQLSTASIASAGGDPAPCPGCGTPLGVDQRYCLECGERRTPISGFLLGASAPDAQPAARGPVAPESPGPVVASSDSWRGGGVLVLAGVGVLMLAMAVGVLVGRASAPGQGAVAPQVITVGALGAGVGAGSAGTTTPSETSFSGDWPAATSGYTVELQTLPSAGTTPAAVAAAKSAAEGKGAKAVGALDSGEYSSLKAGSYVIYAGVYRSRAAASKQLAKLKASFPSASVIRVSDGASNAARSSGSSSGAGSGSSISHPAPPSVLEGLKSTKGKSYEEKSKNLPNVISTG